MMFSDVRCLGNLHISNLAVSDELVLFWAAHGSIIQVPGWKKCCPLRVPYQHHQEPSILVPDTCCLLYTLAARQDIIDLYAL